MVIFGIFVLSLSFSLQLAAAFLAFRLIRVTKRHIAWILIATALFLMEIRRCILLFRMVLGGSISSSDLFAELVAMATSALMVAGIAWITPLFLSIKKSEEALRESKEWFFTTLKSIGDAVITTDTKGNITFMNHTAQDLTGWKESMAIGKPLKKAFTIIDEQTGEDKEDPVAKVIQKDSIVSLDNHTLLVARDGGKVPIDDSAAPIRNEQGNLIGVVLVFRDITERRQAEDEIKLAHQELDQIFNTAADGMRVIDKDFSVIRINDRFADLIGLNKEKIIVQKCYEEFHGDYCHTSDCTLKRIFSGEEYIEYDAEKELQDGNRISCIVTATPLRGAKGELIGLVESFKDVTERKQIEEALKIKTEQERLSNILDGNPIPTFVIDYEHKVTLWNRACESLTNVPKEQALGIPVDSGIFYQGQIRSVLADLVLDMDTGYMVDLYGNKNLTKSHFIPEAFAAQDLLTVAGVKRHLYFLATRLRDSKGQVIGAIETIQDVTEREQLHGQLLHAQKMEAVGRLAGGIAHDFNNLLVVIRGYSEFLLSRLDPQDPIRKEIEVIRNTGDRAASLTRQLLAFSRRQMLQPKVLDLNLLVSDMEKMLRRLIGEDIELVTIPGQTLYQIKADPGQIEQVIMNLAVNARDAMPMGGKLTISTQNITLEGENSSASFGLKSGKFVRLLVSDTGVGIDKTIIDQIFEPFFSTKGIGKGTGLGLSTVYGIVEQHGGWITVDSELGKGSAFYVYLPALIVAQSEEEIKKVNLSVEFRGNGERILLVEDEEGVREFNARMLIENGYLVLVAGSAEEAIDIFNKEDGNFDLILCDVVLPGKNGLELADQLVSIKSSLKIILNSGYTDDRSQWALINKRKFSFLKKPYNLIDLLAEVKKVLAVSL